MMESCWCLVVLTLNETGARVSCSVCFISWAFVCSSGDGVREQNKGLLHSRQDFPLLRHTEGHQRARRCRGLYDTPGLHPLHHTQWETAWEWVCAPRLHQHWSVEKNLFLTTAIHVFSAFFLLTSRGCWLKRMLILTLGLTWHLVSNTPMTSCTQRVTVRWESLGTLWFDYDSEGCDVTVKQLFTHHSYLQLSGWWTNTRWQLMFNPIPEPEIKKQK